jgi:hypothetical protein
LSLVAALHWPPNPIPIPNTPPNPNPNPPPYGQAAPHCLDAACVLFLLGHLHLTYVALAVRVLGVAWVGVCHGLYLACKWGLLGRVQPGAHALWGGFYRRWWATDAFFHAITHSERLGLATVSQLPLCLPLWLRCCGATIGPNTGLSGDKTLC